MYSLVSEMWNWDTVHLTKLKYQRIKYTRNYCFIAVLSYRPHLQAERKWWLSAGPQQSGSLAKREYETAGEGTSESCSRDEDRAIH